MWLHSCMLEHPCWTATTGILASLDIVSTQQHLTLQDKCLHILLNVHPCTQRCSTKHHGAAAGHRADVHCPRVHYTYIVHSTDAAGMTSYLGARRSQNRPGWPRQQPKGHSCTTNRQRYSPATHPCPRQPAALLASHWYTSLMMVSASLSDN